MRNDFFRDVHTLISTSSFVEKMENKQKKCKQLQLSTVQAMNDLAKSFKDWCHPELNLPMFHHVLNDSLTLLLSDDQLEHGQRVKNGSKNGQIRGQTNNFKPIILKFQFFK